MTYGSAGNGSASHLATLLLAETASLDMVHAPYKGAGPAITDLLGGRLDFMVTTIPSVFGFIDSGKLRPLAVTTAAPHQAAARCADRRRKRLAELPGRRMVRLRGAEGHAAGDREDLREATVEAINSPEVLPRLEIEGAEPVGNTPEEFADFMKKELIRWADVIKKAGIGLD